MISASPLPATMHAWLCHRYGGPEALGRTMLPVPAPRPEDVLVRIHATTVSSADARVRALRLPRGFGVLGRPLFGWFRPRQPILGTEFAGTIAAVGERVTAWRPGDAVIGFPGATMGSHAEFRTMSPGRPLIAKPASLSFAEAAALCFGGTTALHYLRKAALQPGQSLLVIGASGAVGSAMVQLARHLGARVTAVVGPHNRELASKLGADTVIDYSREDFTSGATRYDIVADTVGAATFRRCLPILNEHGRYLGIAADLPGLLALPAGTKRSIVGPAPERIEDVVELGRLAATGVLRPLIDEVFAFDRLPAAHARVDSGRKRGSAVVQIVPE